MFKILALLTLAASAIVASPIPGGGNDPTTPQFQGPCKIATDQKYYSIDKLNNKCGETCFNPSRYNTLHFFEPGLTVANTTNPCVDHGYPVYINSPTHGFLNVKVTLDMYGPKK